MNYIRHYSLLIERARIRILTSYRERHHVLPRCMGGDNSPDNLVDLTAEEHYVAHQLLVKCYPKIPGLVFAAIRQSRNCKGNKMYGWLRRRMAASMKGTKMSQEHRVKMSVRHKGIPKSPEHKAKIAAALLGKKKSPLSAEHRAKIGDFFRGRKMPSRSAEWSARIGVAAIGNQRRLGMKHSVETRAKISRSRKSLFEKRRQICLS